jgi:hypothetical protein
LGQTKKGKPHLRHPRRHSLARSSQYVPPGIHFCGTTASLFVPSPLLRAEPRHIRKAYESRRFIAEEGQKERSKDGQLAFASPDLRGEYVPLSFSVVSVYGLGKAWWCLNEREKANKLGIGNRSSIDDSKSDGPEDETTVVEPEQGNGEDIFLLEKMQGRG